MALKFLEGFELYPIAGRHPFFAQKWEIVTQSFGNEVSAGRYFGKAFTLGKDWTGLPDQIRTFKIADMNTVVIGFNFRRGVSSVNGEIVALWNGTQQQLSVRVNARAIDVFRGTTKIHTFVDALANATDLRWYHLQFKVVVGNAGSIQLLVDGVNQGVINSLDTDDNNSGIVDRISFKGHDQAYRTISWHIDDIYVDDADFLGPIVIEGLRPSANGDVAEFTPSRGTNFENVDDLDRSNFNSSNGGENLLSDFSSGLDGWTGNWTIVSGKLTADQRGSRSSSKSFDAPAGSTLSLETSKGGESDGGVFVITLDGTSVFSNNSNSFPNQTLTFPIATSGKHTLTVSQSGGNADAYGPVTIDNVKVIREAVNLATDLFQFGDLQHIKAGVKGVVATVAGKRTSPSNPQFKFLVRIDGTDHESSVTEVSDAAIGEYKSHLWVTNPVTQSSWTTSELNAAQFGIKKE